MFQRKTRVRLTWAFVFMCMMGMIIGWRMGEANVVNASLASCSLVVMAYIGGKTINNNSKRTNESNSQQ